MKVERLDLGRKKVIVGIRLDGYAKELLDWAVVKVADPGDSVVAIHVCRNSGYIPKEKVLLDGYLEDYEGLCNKKQVSLSAEVMKGNSIRKALVREAKTHGASTVIVGITRHSALGGQASIAKYCAKKLPLTIEVMAIHNGKVAFSRCSKISLEGVSLDPKASAYGNDSLSTRDTYSEFGESEISEMSRFSFDARDGNMSSRDDAMSPIGRRKRVSLSSIFSLPAEQKPGWPLLETVSSRDDSVSPIGRLKRGSLSSISLPAEDFTKQRPGWPLLQTASSVTQLAVEARKMSVVQWVMTLPSRPLSDASSQSSSPMSCNTDDSLQGESPKLAEITSFCKEASLLELPKDLELILMRNPAGCTVFSLDFLKMSTSGFSSGNLIGRGGCNSVFKGVLPQGKEVAVKIFFYHHHFFPHFLPSPSLSSLGFQPLSFVLLQQQRAERSSLTPSPRSGYSYNRAGAVALLQRWLSTHRVTPPSISLNAFLSLPIFTVLLSAYLICRLSSRSLCQISSMRLKKGVTKGKGKTRVTKGKGKTSEPEGMEKNRPSKREAERNDSETERVVKLRKIRKDLADASASHPLSETVKDSKKLEDVLIKSKKEVKVVVKRERYKVVCKPAKLWDLISILNEAQKTSIKNVGFGGLLSFREWNYVSWSNVFWFIENFNPYSRVLTFENGRNIVLTAADIEDLFLLPRGTGEGSSVLYYERKDVVGSEEIQNYKERLGLGNTPTLKSVFDLLANSSDARFNTGSDDFVVLFILYAMCTFLAPTANTQVELSLLRTLLDVRNIGNRDWCSFVVNKLCKALESFKEKNYRVINGCLPVLPLLYCHRFKWQGICKPYTLPLIQHWTSENFNDRFKQEVEGDSVFGRGDWVEGVFPISEHKNEEVTADMDGKKEYKDADEAKQCPHDEAFPTSSEFITYKLPEGEKTDMCISAISKNDLQKSFLILKRDFNVIVSNHIDRVEELKKSTPKTPEVERGPSVSPTPPSQTDSEFWKSDEVIKEVEEIIKNFRTVNKEKILNNDYPMFDLNEIPSCSQQSFQPMEEDIVEQCLEKENVQPGNDENLNGVDTSLDGSDIVIGCSYRMQEEYGDLEERIQPQPEMQVNVDANLTMFTRRKNRGIEDPCIPTFRLLSQSSVEESQEYEEVLAEKTQNQYNVETEKLAEIMMKLNQVDVDEEICQQKSTDIEMSEAVREHYKLHKTDEAMNVCSVDPMQCSSNIEWMTDKPTFKSRFINNNARYWKEMSRQEKDIADFCFHEHRPMNTSNVFMHNLYRWKFVMNFNGIRSLNDGCFIDTIVIDAWALMLNKKSKFYSLKKSTQPQNFYFNTQHSSYLECILRRDDPKVIKSKAFDVRSCWHFCLKQMIQLNDLKSFTFFFIPICFNSHFIGVVVNIDQKKIQYLDNILGNCEEGNEIWMLLQIVKQQFSIFLHDMEHPKAGMVESFPIEDVPLDWKSDKSNVDCGVYLMHHMEHFHGFPYINTELSQAPQRRKLRAMYCSRIILSDLNTCRDEILNEILTFAKRKK